MKINEEMSFEQFSKYTKKMLENKKLNPIAVGDIRISMKDKDNNFKRWFDGKRCTFVHPFTGRRISVGIGYDIEAIYHFLRYCRMIATKTLKDQSFADYLAFLIARSNSGGEFRA